MLFDSRTTAELTMIAKAGGGFHLSAGARRTDELIQIAAAAANSGARIHLFGLASRTTEELISIAAAGKGAVVYEPTYPSK